MEDRSIECPSPHGFEVIRHGNKAISGRSCRVLAFTLAEVLITLAIIGVVAALTIPTVITKQQKEQTIVGLKKAYSELSGVVNMVSTIHGTLDTWDYGLSGKEFFNKYLKDNLDVIKVCEDNQSHNQCFGIDYYYLNGKKNNDSNSNQLTVLKNASHKVVLKNGMILYISRPNEGVAGRAIAVDINGVKKPNVVGKDLFVFGISALYKSLIVAHIYESRKTLIEDKNNGCSKNAIHNAGYYCGALIVKDGWKISDDYPW